jgi:hypothetical protein
LAEDLDLRGLLGLVLIRSGLLDGMIIDLLVSEDQVIEMITEAEETTTVEKAGIDEMGEDVKTIDGRADTIHVTLARSMEGTEIGVLMVALDMMTDDRSKFILLTTYLTSMRRRMFFETSRRFHSKVFQTQINNVL